MWILPKNLQNSPISPSAPDTEELISDLKELASLSEQSLMWRSKPSSAKTWLQRWKKGGLMLLLSGRILKPSIGDSLMEKWISCQEASLVNLLVKQEEEMEAKTLDTCGHTSLMESNDWGDLPLFSSRMLKESSVQNSKTDGQIQREQVFCNMSSENWKGWVTKQRQEYSRRVKLAPHINANESLYLVSIQDSTNKEETLLLQDSMNKTKSYILPQEVLANTRGNQSERSWATPTAAEGGKVSNNPFNMGQRELGNDPILHGIREKQLENQKEDLNQVKAWTTPISRDSMEITINKKLPTRKDGKQRMDTMPRQVHSEANYTGKLNPRWVETLMGVPVGWTSPNCTHVLTIEQMNLECLETELYPEHVQEQLESCGINWGTPRASMSKGTGSIGTKKSRIEDQVRDDELKNWATPRVHTPGENVNKLYNKDGSIWDQVGPMYRPSGTIGGTNLQLQAQLENKKSEPMEDKSKSWGTPTTSQLQLNESLDSYLRRSKKRIDNGNSVFPTQLTFEVEAEESGVDIKKELEEHKKLAKKNIPMEYLINENDSPEIVNLIEVLYKFAMDSAPMNFMMLPKRFNHCLVGHTYQGNPVYNYNSMISVYCKEDKMTVEEAVEYMDFNVLCAYYGKDTIQPIFLFI